MTESKRANPLVFVLVCFFASSAWLGSYSTWMEMTIFTTKLPEGWALGSIFTAAIQVAAIGPLIFMCIDRCTKIPMPRGKFIQLALILCALGNLPLSFFWDKTIKVFGYDHSVTVISMAFFIGILNISSEVIFMPYMCKFRAAYLPAYFIGVGLSSFIPSLVSIIQNASDYNCVFNNATSQLEPVFVEPRFSVRTFYLIMFAWMGISTVSFFLINNHEKSLEKLCIWPSKKPHDNSTIELPLSTEELSTVEIPAHETPVEPITSSVQLHRDLFILVCLATIGCELNTIIPSIQSYAGLPYSQKTYFWSLVLSSLAQPLGAFASVFIHVKRTSLLIGLSLVCAFCTAFTVLIAAQSPNPILKNSIFGSILTITLQFVIYALGFLLRTGLIEAYRDDGSNMIEQEWRLFVGGLVTQSGTFFGGIVMFLLVNVFSVFKDAPSC
ncbi:Riboflavin transporter [Aphelenchoides besseyi]|nr:Riboflavin transporter [Aphelenchoides besseyi]